MWECIVHLQFKQHARIAPLLPSLNVDVCCSGAPRTTEAAPAIPTIATPMNCKSERIDTTTRKGNHRGSTYAIAPTIIYQAYHHANRPTAPERARLPAPAQPPTPAAASPPDGATSEPRAPSSAGAAWRPCHDHQVLISLRRGNRVEKGRRNDGNQMGR